MTTQERIIYNSLPPQVTGKKCGEVVIKITKFIALNSSENSINPPTLINYIVKFHWWGQNTDSIQLNLPWKVGNPIDEAIFPIRVNRYYFEEYLSDMNELHLEIIDNHGMPFGYANIQMETIIHRNLIYREGISVFKHGFPKIEIAKLFIEFVCHFDHNVPLKPEKKSKLSVFQRVEALVTADSNSKYTEWPDHTKSEMKAAQQSVRIEKKEGNSPLPPLLARKEAARKHLAGLKRRNHHQTHHHQTGVLPNNSSENDFESPSIHEIDTFHNNNDTKHDNSNSTSDQTKLETQPIGRVEIMDPNTYIMERAQELLHRVKRAAAQSSSKQSTGEKYDPLIKNELKNFSLNPTENLKLSERNHHHRKEDIDVDWLLRGVPEVYEESNIVSDDLVEQLLAEGGEPPSQLQYPILYSNNQAMISQLRNVRQLHLHFNDLFVFGAKCGLRKDGTFIVVHPPPGCFDHNHERTPVIVDLSTSQDPIIKQKNILKNYHVGSVPLDQTIIWNVNLTDSLIQDWLNYSVATGLNCIQIEFYSYLTPRTKPSTSEHKKNRFPGTKPVRRNSTMLIGTANIPLNGIFSSPTLAVNVSVSIVLDQMSHTLIVDRFQRMPIGVKLKPLPLGNSAGYAKCQLSLRNDFGNFLKQPPRDVNQQEGNQLTSIVTLQDDENKIEMKPIHTHLEDALEYVPIDRTSLPQQLPQQQQQHPSYLCVALHHLTLFNFQSFLTQFNFSLDTTGRSKIDIVCIHKVALSSVSLQDRVIFTTTIESLLKGEQQRVFNGKIHPLRDNQIPGSQYFEFWIKYSNVSKLIGLFPYSSDSPHSSYSIMNPLSNQSMGTVKLEITQLPTEERAKLWLAKCLTNESIRVMLNQQKKTNSDSHNLPDNLIVPDKQPESRKAENEDLGIPLHFESHNDPEDFPVPFHSPLPVAPPKYSDEPLILLPPLPPHPLNQPIKPESIQISTTCSIDSLEEGRTNKVNYVQPDLQDQDDDNNDVDDNDGNNVNASSTSTPLNQSLDSLTSFRPPNTSPHPVQEQIHVLVHVLELSVEGVVDSSLVSQDSLGYFVCYNFPGLDDQQALTRTVRGGLNHQNALWWDNECAILNSRNIHTFDSVPGKSPISSLGLDLSQQDFILLLVRSDLDGNLPVTPNSIAKIRLPMAILITALDRSNFNQRVTLDIEQDNNEYSHGKLKLILNHRVIPHGIVGRISSEQFKQQQQQPSSPQLHSHVEKKNNSFELHVEVNQILHLADLPTLQSTHEIFLYCSITTHQTLPIEGDGHFISSTQSPNQMMNWNLQFSLPFDSFDNTSRAAAADFHQRSLNLLVYSRPKWLIMKKNENKNCIHLGDVLVGSTVIELYPLFLSGFPRLDGWYHIMDNTHRSIGQIKLSASIENPTSSSPPSPSPTSSPSTSSPEIILNEPELPSTEISLSTALATLIHDLEITTNSLLRIPNPTYRINLNDNSLVSHHSEVIVPNHELDWDLNSLSTSDHEVAEYLEPHVDEERIPEAIDSHSVDSEFFESKGSSPTHSPEPFNEGHHIPTDNFPFYPSSLHSPTSSSSSPHSSTRSDSDHNDDIDNFNNTPPEFQSTGQQDQQFPASTGDLIVPEPHHHPLPTPSLDHLNDTGHQQSLITDGPEPGPELHLQSEPEPEPEPESVPVHVDPPIPVVITNPSPPSPPVPVPVPQLENLSVKIDQHDTTDEPHIPIINSPILNDSVPGSSVASVHSYESDDQSDEDHDDNLHDLLSHLNIVAENSELKPTINPPERISSSHTSLPSKPLSILPFSPIVPPPHQSIPPHPHSNHVTLASILNQSIPPSSSAPVPSQKEKPLNSPSPHKCNLSQDVKDISDIIRTVMKTTHVEAKWTKSPGRRRQFLDAETNRITKAMKVSLNEYNTMTINGTEMK